MHSGRRLSLPIDPWPRASLGERLSITVVLSLLLFVPFCAAGAACVLIGALALFISRSYGLGTALRAVIDRHAARAVVTRQRIGELEYPSNRVRRA